MKTLTFTHSDTEKKELFAWIGEACASAAVRNELGAPITSTPGDIWILAVEGEALHGFCAVTVQKNGKAKMHGFYSDLSGKAGMAESMLIPAAEQQAMALGAKSIHVVDFVERRRVYEFQGWKAGIERGKRFRDYSKELKEGEMSHGTE